MGTIPNWPSVVDDNGDGISGTPLNAVFWQATEDAIAEAVQGTVNPAEVATDIIDEVVEARGSRDTLDERISETLELDGTLKDFASPPLITVGGAIVTRPGALLFQASGSVAAGTSQTTLYTVTLPANVLDQIGVGRVLRMNAWGQFAANGNAKVVNMKVGGLTVTWNTSTNGAQWNAHFDTTLTGATTGDMHGDFKGTAAAVAVGRATGALDPTGTITCSVTASGVAASDVLGFGFVVELL